LFIAISDGVEHAGVCLSYNFGETEDNISFLETFVKGFTAKTLTTILLDETEKLYEGKPGDDATVCSTVTHA
jgi:hypothetical protein